MPSGAIVVHFNIFENNLAHFFSGDKVLTMDDFHLHRVEEAFGAGVVVTVPLGAHAADQRVLCQ